MNTPLRQAAQAMIDRWDSPYWKHAPTADYIDELRKALDAELAQSVEPVATEPSGERAELIAKLRTGWTVMEESEFERLDGLCRKAADMLEADAQQAKRVPMTEKQIDKIHADTARLAQIRTTFFIAFARAIEARHGITEPKEDLYALALKADNWGQP